LQLDQDGIALGVATPAQHFPKPSALVQRLPHIALEAVVEKAKHIEKRGLAGTIGADHHKKSDGRSRR
jgi:hypothetical protein